MAKNANERSYPNTEGRKTPATPLSVNVQVGLIAAASAIAGGLAVAWWNRKTLQKLQDSIASDNLRNSGIHPEDGGDSDVVG